MMKPIKMIAVDMDGTLLNNAGKVTMANLEAIRDAQQAGIVFAICTGRFYENASIFVKDLGLDCPLITCNGGKLTDAPYGKVLSRHTMPTKIAIAVFERLEALGASYFVFSDGVVGIRKHGEYHHSQIDFGTRMSTEAATHYRYGSAAIRDAITQGIYKYYVNIGRDGTLYDETFHALHSLADIDISQSGISNIEIMPYGVDKEQGVRDMATLLEVPMENVMAIGDQGNDLPMIRAAGWGVAMGNATAQVKAHANAVTASNEEDGVAQAIRRYALLTSACQG